MTQKEKIKELEDRLEKVESLVFKVNKYNLIVTGKPTIP